MKGKHCLDLLVGMIGACAFCIHECGGGVRLGDIGVMFLAVGAGFLCSAFVDAMLLLFCSAVRTTMSAKSTKF